MPKNSRSWRSVLEPHPLTVIHQLASPHGEYAAKFVADGYGKGINAFNALMADWRAKGEFEGLGFG